MPITYLRKGNTMKINVMLDQGAKMPTKAHETDAGFDIYCTEPFDVPARGFFKVDTGVHMEIPKGYVGFLKSKSGLNVLKGIRGEGVIDSGYTGSIVVKLYNDTDLPVCFRSGEKISQIVILPIPEVELNLVDRFTATERGDGGFGSTGRF